VPMLCVRTSIASRLIVLVFGAFKLGWSTLADERGERFKRDEFPLKR
jgi:hypothetical protein